MGFSVTIASTIVLIGLVVLFGSLSAVLVYSLNTLSDTTREYLSHERDKLDVKLELEIETINADSCIIKVKNSGTKTIFLQNQENFQWNSIVISYQNNSHWLSYIIENYTVLEVRVTGTEVFFDPASHSFINPGEEARIRFNLPEEAPHVTAYNYVDITSPSATHIGEQGEIDISGNLDGTTAQDPAGMSVVEFDNAGYDAIESSNDLRHATADPFFGDNAFYRFRFKITDAPSSITRIEIAWEGHANVDDATNQIRMCIWNATGGAWSFLGENHGASDIWINATVTTNCAYYVDASDYMWIAIWNKDTSQLLRCDYIQVVITAGAYQIPQGAAVIIVFASHYGVTAQAEGVR